MTSDQPGGLRNETVIRIQTRQALKFIAGRQSGNGVEPISGLFEFGRRLKLIWLSAEVDDPYADWYLVQIEAALQDAKQRLQGKIADVKLLMGERDGVSIQLAESQQPIQVPIYFQNPYGYMGAYLVMDFDAFVRALFTAKHVGLLDRTTTDKLLHEASRMLRHVFLIATHWKFTGVTRADLVQSTPSGLNALKIFGVECPREIVAEALRASHAPRIKRKTASAPVLDSVSNVPVEGEHPDRDVIDFPGVAFG